MVNGAGGTWKFLLQLRNNPCFGREYEVVVQSATKEELVIEVNRSKLISGCTDSVLHFKPTGDKTLEGLFADGRKLTLTRVSPP